MWRHAHQFTRPELVGEVAEWLFGPQLGLCVTPPCHAPGVDIVFHRYTRPVILALPHSGAPGKARVRREVAHA